MTHRSEVVKLKYKLFREVLGSSPDDPSHTDRTHSVLVTRSVDTIRQSHLQKLPVNDELTFELEVA